MVSNIQNLIRRRDLVVELVRSHLEVKTTGREWMTRSLGEQTGGIAYGLYLLNPFAILIVSHSSTLIRELCSHCLWLDSGRVRAFGGAAEVVDAYEAEICDLV